MKLSSQSAFQHLSSMRDMFSHLFSFFFFPPSLFLLVYLFYMIFKRDKSLIIFSRGNQKLNISFFTLFIHTQINSRDNICVLRGMVVMSIEGKKKKNFRIRRDTQGREILDVTLLCRHRDCTVLIANSLLYERQLFMRRLVMTSAPRS